MVRKLLMGAAAVVAVPVAIAGGYFLPHPPPDNPPDYFDLPPASIVELPDEELPKRTLPPHPVKDHSVARA
jgi:hypothetical protein